MLLNHKIQPKKLVAKLWPMELKAQDSDQMLMKLPPNIN